MVPAAATGWALAIPISGCMGHGWVGTRYTPPRYPPSPHHPGTSPTPVTRTTPVTSTAGTRTYGRFRPAVGDPRGRIRTGVLRARRGLCLALPATLRPLLFGPPLAPSPRVFSYSQLYLSIPQYISVLDPSIPQFWIPVYLSSGSQYTQLYLSYISVYSRYASSPAVGPRCKAKLQDQ